MPAKSKYDTARPACTFDFVWWASGLWRGPSAEQPASLQPKLYFYPCARQSHAIHHLFHLLLFMSARAAAKAAANHITKHVIHKTNPAVKAPTFPPTFLAFQYQANPKPINCTTFPMTKEFALDSTHPLHISTTRRLAAFDPSALHWTVRTPLDLSKKATVRSWALRRVRVAFREALKEGGWQIDGSRIAADGQRRLSGALAIHVHKDKAVIEASGQEVKKQCLWVLQKVLKLQTGPTVERKRNAKEASSKVRVVGS